MKKYHKIQTVYKRALDKTLLEGQFSIPELAYLKDNVWNFFEKIDGTNIRVLWDGSSYEFRGKTDDANTPQLLLQALESTFSVDAMAATFGDTPVCLYGEGYGVHTAKGGGNYRPDNGFVLFDILIDTWWLLRPNVEKLAEQLGVDIVPIIGQGTLFDMVERCRAGFNSTWGDFPAEGIVARPQVELFTRKNERLITKCKYKDFPR